ncbi:unnamed protein product [Blepharisma stoltei]|uniref:PNPLA domain-containing protein n=1 Tax=Blepharisma stoltei TaxID=1481888 RepID=A0AAU9JRL4_9CILI|nr:unnamed protein product [Blepharisma stoltei]
MVSIWFLISLLGQTYAQSTCYALTMEGGGSHGAYEAGSIQELAYTAPVSVAYNVVTGISTGALNAGGVAQFKQGNEKAMADFLVNTWLTLNGSASVYVEWDGGLLEGLLFQRGIYDNKPLVKTLNSRYTYGINRNITIGSTNLDTGLFGQFNESLGSKDIITAITCSACPPWYFPPTNFLGSTWVDGGVVINLDVFAAVNRCLDVTGGDQSKITVDMIYDYGDSPLPAETNMTTLYIFKRVSEIRNYDSQMWFYYNALTAWPKVNYRYVIFASQPMSGGFVPLDFNQTTLEWEVQLGKNDTAKVISEGIDGKTILTERYLKNKSKIIYP